MSNFKYRPEIDGLRALAVIGVVLYHIGLGFPGGYVGVDVFFVISGYLITGIIVKDLSNGTFSMLDFWVRRIKRILPAVTVVILACLIVGYFTMDGVQYRALGRSATAQSLMVSNIYFYRNASDYFANNADLLPLLHTWSLAVEEQFYALFPLLLFCFSRLRKISALTLTTILGAGSLLLSLWAMYRAPDANFYFLPHRAWELMAGSVLAMLANQPKTSRTVAELASCCGLVLIVAPMLFYSYSTVFPGWTAIPPVAGSAMFIWANSSHNTAAGKILSFKPIVFIGLISYSLYLWHWPLLVFTKYVIADINLFWKLSIFMGSLILSSASWKWVETPFRRKGVLSKPRSAYGFAGLSTLGVLLLSAAIWKMEGLPARFNDGFNSLREDIHWRGWGYESKPGHTHIGLVASSRNLKETPSFAIWGDSHGMTMSQTIDETAKKHGLMGVAYLIPGQRPVTGIKENGGPDSKIHIKRVVLQSLIDSGAKNLILVSRWSAVTDGLNNAELAHDKTNFQEGLMEEGDDVSEVTPTRTIQLLAKHLEMMALELRSYGVKVWLIKQVPESNNIHTARAFYLGSKYPRLNNPPTQFTTSKNDHLARQKLANGAIDSVPEGLINVIDPSPYFFKASDRVKVYGDRSYYRDDDHLTRAGADYYLSEMFDEIFARIVKLEADTLQSEDDMSKE